jgi:hypothetical protein
MRQSIVDPETKTEDESTITRVLEKKHKAAVKRKDHIFIREFISKLEHII